MWNSDREELLFSKYSIFGAIENQKAAVQKEAEVLPERRLRHETLDALVAEFAKKLSIDVPVIDDSGITVSKPREVELRRSRNDMFFDDDYSTRTVKGTSVTFRIPYIGDRILFFVRPSSCTLSFPRASVNDGSVELTFSGITLEGVQLKAEFEGYLRSIKDCLSTLSADVAQFNRDLKTLAFAHLEARKSRLKQNDDLVGGLGYRVQ